MDSCSAALLCRYASHEINKPSAVNSIPSRAVQVDSSCCFDMYFSCSVAINLSSSLLAIPSSNWPQNWFAQRTPRTCWSSKSTTSSPKYCSRRLLASSSRSSGRPPLSPPVPHAQPQLLPHPPLSPNAWADVARICKAQLTQKTVALTPPPPPPQARRAAAHPSPPRPIRG